MGQVVNIVNESRVDDAWNDYVEMARQLSDDHSKITDRPFNEELARRYNHWRDLFLTLFLIKERS